MKNWTIKQLLRLGYTIPLVIIVVMGIVTIYQLKSIGKQIDMVADTDGPILITVESLKADMLLHRRYEKDFFINIGKSEKQAKYLSTFNAQQEITSNGVKTLQTLLKQDDEVDKNIIRQATELDKDLSNYFQIFHSIVEQTRQDSSITTAQANSLMGPAKKHIHEFETKLMAIQNMAQEMYKESVQATKHSISTGKSTIVGSIIFIIVVIVIASILINKLIESKLSRTIANLANSANQTLEVTNSMAQGSQVLAEGATEQAASIEETSAAVEELASQTRQNSDNASQANDLMSATTSVVNRATTSMDELTASMNDITQASEKTSKIIKTIDEIAFQTNLLALNAAVEAARAGEAGAGFAVVADEVRNLAMRAAEAASDTSGLIEQTGNRVKTGAGLVDKTTEEFNAVAENTSKINTLIEEISVASSEQADGVGQISNTITEMDSVIQRVAATAEETASASDEVVNQAQVVREVVTALEQITGLKTASKLQAAPVVPPQARQASSPVKPTPAPPAKALPQAPAANKSEDVIPFDDDDFEDF